MTKTTLRLQNY